MIKENKLPVVPDRLALLDACWEWMPIKAYGTDTYFVCSRRIDTTAPKLDRVGPFDVRSEAAAEAARLNADGLRDSAAGAERCIGTQLPRPGDDDGGGAAQIHRREDWRMIRDSISPLHAEVGKSICAARIRQGLTQADLEERTGIAQADISLLENGRSNPTVRTLQRLADGIGCPLAIGFKSP